MFNALKQVRVILAVALLLPLLCTAATDSNWPQFRGPTGDGHASSAKTHGVPLQWSETNNVKWKTEIPHRGWSTPVVLDNQVWLTTATMDGHEFFGIAVDAVTGKVLFNEKVFSCEKPEPLGNNVNCYATPSPVIEPGRVYLHFGTYGTACLDTGARKVCGNEPTCHVATIVGRHHRPFFSRTCSF